MTFSRNIYDGNQEAVGCDFATSNKVFDHETFYNTGSAKTVDNSAFHMKAGTVTVTNSIVSGVRGYAFYALRFFPGSGFDDYSGRDRPRDLVWRCLLGDSARQDDLRPVRPGEGPGHEGGVGPEGAALE